MKNQQTIILLAAAALCLLFSGCEAMAVLFHGPKPDGPPVYTVTFEPNGATGAAPVKRTVDPGTVVSLPTNGGLKLDGNWFTGWNESSTGVGLTYFNGDSVTVTGDMIFYAQWITDTAVRYEVKFDPNGATNGTPPVFPPVFDGMAITFPGPVNLVSIGKTFAGWNTEIGGGGTHYNAGSSYIVRGNITLYAQWVLSGSVSSYTVAFNSGGGSFVPSQTVISGFTATRPAPPIRNGYTFDNWYGNSGLTSVYNFSTPVTGNVTLYAKWDAVSSGGGGGGQSLTNIADIGPYLAAQSGGTSLSNPINLSVQINLGDMTQEGSGWQQLRDVIKTSGKYVGLDLSGCTMNGTEFNSINGFGPDDEDNIVSIVVPDTVKSIGQYVFVFRKNLAGVTIPASATLIENPFRGCTSLISFTLTGSGSMSVIGDGRVLVRNGTELAAHPSASGNVTLPAGITSIGYGAFWACENLIQISLPGGLTSIGDYAFYACSELTQISLPVGLISIGNNAFQWCFNLTLTYLPDGVTTIGGTAFYNCGNLTEITLPASVTLIGEKAFSTSSLTLVTCHATMPPTLRTVSDNDYAFNIFPGGINYITNPGITAIKVPADSVNAYKTATGWSAYASKIVAIE